MCEFFEKAIFHIEKSLKILDPSLLLSSIRMPKYQQINFQKHSIPTSAPVFTLQSSKVEASPNSKKSFKCISEKSNSQSVTASMFF
jgi:hypothetical protein